MSGDLSGCHRWGGVPRHLVGRHQACCQTPCKAEDGARMPTKNSPAQQVSSAEGRDPALVALILVIVLNELLRFQ